MHKLIIGERFFRFKVRLDNASDAMDDASKKNIKLLLEEGKKSFSYDITKVKLNISIFI